MTRKSLFSLLHMRVLLLVLPCRNTQQGLKKITQCKIYHQHRGKGETRDLSLATHKMQVDGEIWGEETTDLLCT
jgi:hypothetical protein